MSNYQTYNKCKKIIITQQLTISCNLLLRSINLELHRNQTSHHFNYYIEQPPNQLVQFQLYFNNSFDLVCDLRFLPHRFSSIPLSIKMYIGSLSSSSARYHGSGICVAFEKLSKTMQKSHKDNGLAIWFSLLIFPIYR